jgi:hypothetical protein
MSKLKGIVVTGESLMELTQCGVYKIHHIKKPKFFYIGSASGILGKKKSTLGFYRRFLEHLHKLEHNTHSSPFLQNVVNKYGLNGLRFEILEVVDSKDRNTIVEREQYYIDLIQPQYNMSKTARCPTVPYTEKRRKEASERMKGKSLEHLHQKVRIKVEQYTKEDVYIQSFNSLKDAAQAVNISPSFLSKCLSGIKPSAGGFKWKRQEKKVG